MSFIFDLPKFENNVAIINEYGEHFYYGDVINICHKFGSYFDTEENELVMVLTQNNIESIVGYLTAVQYNNAVMLVEANLDKELIDNLIKVYQPHYIWGPKENNDMGMFKYQNYALTKCERGSQTRIHPSLSLLLSTSGSTGSPKQVRLTKECLLSNARSIATYLNLTETERPITNLAIHYSYGLSIINSHLMVGATILLTDTPVVRKEFWDFFKAEAGTSLAGVPYTYGLLKRVGFFSMDLPSLRYLTQAGGRMDPRVILEYAKFSHEKNFDLYIMYGATEATARISYLPPEYTLLKPGSIGKAIPNGKLWLINESGSIITEPDTEGELVYQGPNVMMGYAHCREDLSKSDEQSGTLKTGDLAYFDEDGFYYITGRKSRFLKIFGKRVGLSEIEGHLQSKGHNCFCGGEDDILQVAYFREHIHDIQEDIIDAIKKEVFIKFKIPLDIIRVFQINSIPRNSSGKIIYGQIFSRKIQQTGVADGRKSES